MGVYKNLIEPFLIPVPNLNYAYFDGASFVQDTQNAISGDFRFACRFFREQSKNDILTGYLDAGTSPKIGFLSSNLFLIRAVTGHAGATLDLGYTDDMHNAWHTVEAERNAGIVRARLNDGPWVVGNRQEGDFITRKYGSDGGIVNALKGGMDDIYLYNGTALISHIDFEGTAPWTDRATNRALTLGGNPQIRTY